jgi:hypothetical protein
MIKIFLLALACLFISACDVQQSEPDIPIRPASVPEKAFWIGGLDGGVFVAVEKNEELRPSEYLGEIYYVSGDIAYKGKMEVIPKDGTVIDYMNPESYQGWDGDTLYILGNKQLKIKE